MITIPSVFSLLLLLRLSLCQTNVTVTTSKGVVVGFRIDNNPETGASYDAFLGIPYGKLAGRFQPSIPRDPWDAPLSAHADGPMCPQPDQPFSEDCLYLNVFTPVNASLTQKLPVMVYIHGGGCTFGSSFSQVYGPDFLVSQAVVLVTMNYRVGAAGFLTLGTPEAPGNLGMYDTLLALQWVHQEIRVFGGDPSQVTLFGHSAGSVMTQLHYLSPVASDLFNRTIAQSGPALKDGHLISTAEGIRRAKVFSDAVGCKSSKLNNSELLTCLQKVDINIIVSKQNIPLPVEILASGNNLRFVPVEDTLFAKNPFFPKSLDLLMQEAVTRAKPLLTGFATGDGIVKFQDDAEIWRLAEDHFSSFIPWSIVSSLSDTKKSKIALKIEEKYFPKTVEENKILNLVNIYTDTVFAYPNIKLTQMFANFTYGYVFNYQGIWNPMPDYFSQFQMSGAFHGAELTYLFYTTNSSQDLSPCRINLPCLNVRNNIVNLWTTFAKTGVPDRTGKWDPVVEGFYLLIDSTNSYVNRSDIEERHYNFWSTLTSDVNSTSGVFGNLAVIVVALLALFCIGL